MTLDPDILEHARRAAADLADADRQALLARAEYHAAVRRLHLAGGPLREIAAALALSHQRVQQIVSNAGGSWWRRVWRTRRLPADAICTWCHRPPSEVSKLIAGPHVYICDGCVVSAERALAGRPVKGAFADTNAPARGRCSFCGKGASGTRTLATGADGRVCSDCLRVCREILDKEGSGLKAQG